MKGLKYSYKLYGNGIVIHRDPIFSERELAAFDALEFAFRIREEYLGRRQRTTNSVEKSKYHGVDRKKKTEGPTWGEQVTKDKYKSSY